MSTLGLSHGFGMVMSFLLLVLLLEVRSEGPLPSMRDTVTHVVHVQEGDDALLTCVVRHAGDRSVLWKRQRRGAHGVWDVLTADKATVTSDGRFTVMHDTGPEGARQTAGDVWVLVIRDAKPEDTATYVCELNSEPVVRSFHQLNVLPHGLVPPETGSPNDTYASHAEAAFSGRSHNYTDCCLSNNVSTACLGFCNIQSILDGNTGQDPENCETDFPAIVKCMADGRNHVPCCIEERVPDICQDVCRGEYTVITDNIKTHFSCSAYTEQTLACIVEGIELLPSQPDEVEVEATSEKSLKVSWKAPWANHATVTKYEITLKALRSFDAHLIDPSESSAVAQKPETKQVSVTGNKTSLLVGGLAPFTMYEVYVVAENKHGSSLPSYSVRTLTLNPEKSKPANVTDAPKLPDISKCCVEKGVAHDACVDKLCDPRLAGQTRVTDLMICAPWAADTFSCLANGMDHTPCCKRRGLPDVCQALCTGNITNINFNFFKCIRYMSDYSNCLLQGYGVLPGPPTKVHLTNIATDYAILHWGTPSQLGETVQSYNVHYRKMKGTNDEDSEYEAIEKVQSPYILEGLESNTQYEIFIDASNEHGVGEPSVREVFNTQSKLVEEKLEQSVSYDVHACCVSVSVSSICLPLCSYDASMSDLKALAVYCTRDLNKLIRCGAGGRNHTGCCARRGVPDVCQPLCTGLIKDSLLSTAKNCIPYIGNIVQCFEEGSGLLPGPVEELQATATSDTGISIEWSTPTDSANITGYLVYSQKADNTSVNLSPSNFTMRLNVSESSAELSGLETGSVYNIYVVSVNQHGTSLPSSVLVVKAQKPDVVSPVTSITSPPRGLSVSSHSATWVTISWQPPELSHHSDLITYTLHHKTSGEDNFTTVDSLVTSRTMEGLTPNTQYIVFVTASTKSGMSPPSETLIAWTDPAYPAFVEPPTVHPINLVAEGSSMTILCIAMGTPTPTVSLYISGRLVRQETTRHMVTVINNVSRDMDHITCYADNGYGTPMQATRKIIISHVPKIQASGITMAAKGASVVLECKVSARPQPQMVFWRDPHGNTPVIQGPKYHINITADEDEDVKYTMRLTINKISEPDEGDYFCHADNAFGSAIQAVSVRIRNTAASHNVTQCCKEQNVSSACMDACSFYLDIDAVIDKPQCISDFDKLMKCAADGSDHRSCCAEWGVPRRCLEWCRGEPITTARLCLLTHTRTIVSCFQDNRDKLPGPPQKVNIVTLNTHSVKVSWEPPLKNPNVVETYRVFWRELGTHTPGKLDTSNTSLTLTDLKEGVTYECVVKAGNLHGTSVLTEALQFTIDDKYITSATAVQGHEGSGVAVGVALAVIILAALIIVAFCFINNSHVSSTWSQFIRNTKILGLKSQGGVSFENPSYLREVNPDANASTNASTTAPNNGGMSVATVSSGTTSSVWRQEPLQAAQEVNPTLYEELKLGHDRAGFKRLKE